MASTQIVYKGLQTCLEPQFNDQNLPKSPKLQEPNNGKKKNASGWSFLEALENPSMASKNLEDTHVVYVHPMVKRSSSALSSKSLEMCTEGLGSESGSDVSESGDEFCSISMEERERFRAVRMSRCCRGFDRKIRGGGGGGGGGGGFPPPLTSISGSDGTVKVRHHREGGRLVIKAVSVSNGGTNFKAERTNGRLKLSLLKDHSVNYGTGRVEEESYLSKGCSVNDESERVEDESYEEGGSEDSERVKDENWLLKDYFGNDESERDEDENYEEGGDMESPEYSSCDGDVEVAEGEEDGGDWRWKVGCSAGKGELKRLTRCKEGGGNGNKVFATLCSSWVS